ncbi:very short patch repair endonuclease [Sphingopyxis fribergensis]
MADVVAPDVRSRMMAGIRGKDTKPEMLIRKGLHRLGLRFLVHDKRLPGKPDLVFPKWRAAIFVNGCFWHGHNCRLFKLPSTRTEFWRDKIAANRKRDAITLRKLHDAEWRTLSVWECEIKGRSAEEIETLLQRCRNWLTDKAVPAHE